jgi:hypothetical protein
LLNSSPLPVKTSPIGFKPKTGTLHGRLLLSSPLSACSAVLPAESEAFGNTEDEDVFMLVDGQDCLESVKANNVANSGAFAMIVRRNILSTFQDMESSTVHIPVLEMEPSHWDTIKDFLINNPREVITSQADFDSSSAADADTNNNNSASSKTKQVQLQFWMTPTQTVSYLFLSEMTSFLSALMTQAQMLIAPHFALHSQARENGNK